MTHVHARLKQSVSLLKIPEQTLPDIRFYLIDRIASNRDVVACNGFAPAFVTLGWAVCVDIEKFLEIWRAQGSAAQHGNASVNGGVTK